MNLIYLAALSLSFVAGLFYIELGLWPIALITVLYLSYEMDNLRIGSKED